MRRLTSMVVSGLMGLSSRALLFPAVAGACVIPPGGSADCASPCTPVSHPLTGGSSVSLVGPGARGLGPIAPGQSLAGEPGVAALRIRRNQKDIGAADRQLFVDALKDMKAAAPKGNGAVATNRYDEFVKLHDDFCNHANSGFLPWHRKTLWEFESEIRALNPTKYANFTIPYWDWTKDAFPSHLNPAAADNNFMGPDGAGANHVVQAGPFRQGQWKTLNAFGGSTDLVRDFHGINNLITGGPGSLANMLAAATYQDMSNISEGGPELHDNAHVRVGGHLSDPTTGADEPTFFMLHAFIDLLWEKWQIDTTGLGTYQQFGGGPALGANLSHFGNVNSTIGFGGTVNNKVSD